MTDHTPEPWGARTVKASGSFLVRGPNDRTVCIHQPHMSASTSATHEESLANAARIVACVNACAGIPTAQLQVGSVAELVAAADKVLQPADGSDEPSWDLKAAIAAFQKD